MAKKYGSLGIELSSNQLRMVELDADKAVLQTKIENFEPVSGFPSQQINDLLACAQQPKYHLGFSLDIFSSIALSTWIPSSFEEPEALLLSELGSLLVGDSSQYHIAHDLSVSHSKEKGQLAVGVAIRQEELTQVKADLNTLNHSTDLLELKQIALLNLLELFEIDLNHETLLVNIDESHLYFTILDEGKFYYSEKAEINDNNLIESQVLGFLEKHFSENAGTVPICVTGSVLAKLEHFGEDLENVITHLSLDKISEGVWDNHTKYACALPYAIAVKGLEVTND